MKITCQACQSKYTVADDKIQGKVAKIRCKKCGATVLVDASAASQANGAAESMADTAGTSPLGDVWQVSVADGDQRTMRAQELVDAYNTGVVDAQTYVWKEGMTDWVPLAESAEIVELLHRAASAAGAAQGAASPASHEPTSSAASSAVASPQASPTVQKPADAASPVPARVAEKEPSVPKDGNSSLGPHAGFSAPTGAAARREPARPLGSDLFAGKKADEEEVATSVPSNLAARAANRPAAVAGGLGGAAGAPASAVSSAAGAIPTIGTTTSRDEQSVVFSLNALTKRASDSPPGPTPTTSKTPKRTDDSGLIDLNALAKAQEAQKNARSGEPAAAFPAPFLFPAALGQVEVPETPDVVEQKKSRGRYIAIGGGVAIVAIVIAIFAATRPDESVPTTTPSVATLSAPVAPEPPPSATAEPTPTPSVTAEAPKPRPITGGPRRTTKTPPTPTGGQQPTTGAPPPPPPPPPPPKSKCGCAPGDLQCQIRCSAMGK